MNSRRSFFQRVAGLVAAVAIAPEIAFRAKLQMPTASRLIDGSWEEPKIICYYTEGYLKSLEEVLAKNQKFKDVKNGKEFAETFFFGDRIKETL